MHTKLTALLAMLVVAGALAGSASARTNGQAYQNARTCLLSHGAESVIVRHPYGSHAVGGGYAMFGPGGVTEISWIYEPNAGRVTAARVLFYGHSFTAARIAQVKTCVQRSIGLGNAARLTVTQE